MQKEIIRLNHVNQIFIDKYDLIYKKLERVNDVILREDYALYFTSVECFGRDMFRGYYNIGKYNRLPNKKKLMKIYESNKYLKQEFIIRTYANGLTRIFHKSYVDKLHIKKLMQDKKEIYRKYKEWAEKDIEKLQEVNLNVN